AAVDVIGCKSGAGAELEGTGVPGRGRAGRGFGGKAAAGAEIDRPGRIVVACLRARQTRGGERQGSECGDRDDAPTHAPTHALTCALTYTLACATELSTGIRLQAPLPATAWVPREQRLQMGPFSGRPLVVLQRVARIEP